MDLQKNKDENKGFCLFFDWVEDLNYLDGADAWAVVRALYAYYTEGLDPVEQVARHLKATVALMFHQIRRQEAVSEAKAESGRRGGNAKAKVSNAMANGSSAMANDSSAMAMPKQNVATNTNTNTNTKTNTNTNTFYRYGSAARPSPKAAPRLAQSSYDVDSFFEAALEKSMREMEKETEGAGSG